MDDSHLRRLVGKLVSVHFDHGGRIVGTLTISESEPGTVPLFGLEARGASAVPWPADRLFRASMVTNADEVTA